MKTIDTTLHLLISTVRRYGWADTSVKVARLDTASNTVTLANHTRFGLRTGTSPFHLISSLFLFVLIDICHRVAGWLIGIPECLTLVYWNIITTFYYKGTYIVEIIVSTKSSLSIHVIKDQLLWWFCLSDVRL